MLYKHIAASESEEEAIWWSTVARLLDGGASTKEAIDGADLILMAYRQKRSPRREDDRPPAESGAYPRVTRPVSR